MAKNSNSSMNLRMTVYIALFTALIIIGGYISVPVPVGPVPIVLADFFVMVTGLFLGRKRGAISVALYLALGALGLPVFAGGKAGLAVLFGPTGGFLFGYFLVVIAIGLLTESVETTPGKAMLVKNVIALVAGNVLLYLVGVPWLKAVAKMSWAGAIIAGFVPFIAGIIIKIAAAAALGQILLPRFKQTLIQITPQTEEA